MAVSDTSNPVGAAAIIFAVKLLPDTVNCWTLGLVDAVPWQVEMLPVAGFAVIMGVGKEGFTVIVKLTGIPPQLTPGLIKFPKEEGYVSDAVVIIVLLVVFITLILLESSFSTNSSLPSEEDDIPKGPIPTTGMVATTW